MEDQWDAILYAIQIKNCILMLGPDAATKMINGSPQLLSELLSKELVKDIKEIIEKAKIDPANLTQVAQMYFGEKGHTGLRSKVEKFYNDNTDEPHEFHLNLAEIPFTNIISTSFDNMMFNALIKKGKNPKIDFYDFKGKSESLIDKMGTVAEPLIYHLFGCQENLESLVITEDDILDFIVNAIGKKPELPKDLLNELQSERKLFLFLGFGFKNWYLRLLLYIILRTGKKRDNPSFAFEQYLPQDEEEFKKLIFFFSSADYRIQICQCDLLKFSQELLQRYTQKYLKQPAAEDSYKITSGPVIFICHDHADKAFAAGLFEELEKAGFQPWLDKKSLDGGDEWDNSIEDTIKKTDYFIVLMSKALAGKIRGYVLKEINCALMQKKQFRKGFIFIIPCKIEECDILDELKEFQTIDIQDKDFTDLIRSIKRDWEKRRKRI